MEANHQTTHMAKWMFLLISSQNDYPLRRMLEAGFNVVVKTLWEPF